MKRFLLIILFIFLWLAIAATTNGYTGYYFPGHGPRALYRIAAQIPTPQIAASSLNQIDLPIEDIEPTIPLSGIETEYGVKIACVASPAKLLKNVLPPYVSRWSCGISNRTPETVTISEASLAMLLLSNGVNVIPSNDVFVLRTNYVTQNFWTRLTRWGTQIAVPLAISVAGGAVELTPTEGKIAAGLAFGLPRIVGLLEEKIPNSQIPIWSNPIDVRSGGFSLQYVYAEESEIKRITGSLN